MHRLLQIAVMVLGCLLLSLGAHAQDRTVTGTITSSTDKQPLPGVSVLVKGTSNGTVTDIDGVYKISVPADKDILIYSYIGFITKEMTVGSQSEISFELVEDAQQLSEVVVTAFGLEREKKALGFAIQEVKGSDLAEVRSSNVANSLSGRIAGVQITSAGGPGSGSNIAIRGVNSLTTNNLPLVVVDGVPMQQSQNASGTDRANEQRYGGGISEINPDNIANISVLKGPNAAALYGSRAANGVILITTKNGAGQKGIGVEVTSNYVVEEPFIKPQFQNIYGGGSGYRTWYADGWSGTVDGIRGTAGTDESWGAPMDGRLVRQWWTGTETAPLVPQPDNWEQFWATGSSFNNNIAISGANDKGNFRLSVGRSDQKGIAHNNDFSRTNFHLNAGYKFTEKLKITTVAEYIKSGADNRRYQTGQDFQWHHRHLNFDQLRNYEAYRGVHIQRPTDNLPPNWQHTFFTNPYFLQNELTFGNDKHRFLGNVSVNYEFTDWLSVMVRTGTDLWQDTRINITGWERTRNNNLIRGNYEEDVLFNQETNSDFIFTFDKTIANNFSFVVQAGGVNRISYGKRNFARVNDLTIDGIYNLANNFTPNTNTSEISERATNSLFGSFQFGFKNYLFVEGTVRNDWSSTLPSANNSFFYPSVSVSSVLTDMIPALSNNILSFAKIRASWAQVGNDASPYLLEQVFVSRGLWNGQLATYAENNSIANANLKPELTTGIELGADFRFLNGRLGLDVAYYTKSTRNQIMPVDVSRASGYTSQVLNAGEMTNRGIEVMVNGTALKMANGFTWDVSLNFARNINEVVELAEGLQTLTLWSIRGASLEARVGQPYGSLYGRKFARDPQGNVIYRDGYPTVLNGLHTIGNIIPDWLGGVNNTFSFKGITVSALVDIKMGGDIYDMGTSIARLTGVLEESAVGREEGVIGSGVKNVGTADAPVYVTNDVIVPARNYYNYYSGRQFHEAAVFDGSYVKLREVSIGYNFPSKLLEKTNFFRSARVSVVGRNVAMLFSNTPHVDPELSSSSLGFTEGQLPSTRSMGFNLNFGF